MKYLPALLCAAGLVSACSSSPTLTPAQASVSAHLKKTLDDPASYAPVRWGKGQAFTVAMVKSGQARSVMAMADSVKGEATQLLSMYKEAVNRNQDGRMFKAAYDSRSIAHDSLIARVRLLASSRDTSAVGTIISHSFRAKNKLGALVLDSARFVVGKGGVVTVLP